MRGAVAGAARPDRAAKSVTGGGAAAAAAWPRRPAGGRAGSGRRGKGQRPGRARSPGAPGPRPRPRRREGSDRAGAGRGRGRGRRGHTGGRRRRRRREGARIERSPPRGEGGRAGRAPRGNPQAPGLARVPSSRFSPPSFPATPLCAPDALPRLPPPRGRVPASSCARPGPPLWGRKGLPGGEGRLEVLLGRRGPSLGERLWWDGVGGQDALLGRALSDPDPSRLTPLCFPCPHGAPSPAAGAHVCPSPRDSGIHPPRLQSRPGALTGSDTFADLEPTGGRKQAPGRGGSDCPAAALRGLASQLV